MRVALIHDYIKEFGGAERVLKTLTEIFPEAPIYTAFCVKGSTAQREFADKNIKESFLAPILKVGNLYSPLRFLIPLIWGSFDLSDYDLVITSASWYVTRGFKIDKKTKVVCYCHTPPRWLYGYETSVGFTRYLPVKIYAAIVGHFIRMYDFVSAQKPKDVLKFKTPFFKVHSGVDLFIANSKNVAERIKKFYRRDSVIIYPPVDAERMVEATKNVKRKEKYFLIVSRLVGAKGLEEAARAFRKQSKYKLKIVGESAGYSEVANRLKKISGGNVELLGRVSDRELYDLYAKAKGFIALARDEDFGMTVVEAQAAGTPVIAFNGGGFKESVIDGKTGILINEVSEKAIAEAIKKLEKIKWNKDALQRNAMRFSKESFVRKIRKILNENVNSSK